MSADASSKPDSAPGRGRRIIELLEAACDLELTSYEFAAYMLEASNRARIMGA